jgi:uncharacterized damage-inducible protein DinB
MKTRMGEILMRTLLSALLISVVLPVIVSAEVIPPTADAVPEPAAPAAAVLPAGEPLLAHSHFVYRSAMTIVRRAAELMPEENYGFRPVETVRTFGEVVGHIVETQYLFCSAVRGQDNESGRSGTKSKAGLIAALDEARAFCEASYGGLTNETAADPVSMFSRETPALGVMMINLIHTMLHYGNLSTYLRMNGIVPPSSDPELMRSFR